jgi:o-succinylbenzoate---CoA ligase
MGSKSAEMVKSYLSLTINGHHFDSHELHHFCNSQLSNPAVADWESDIYRFILEWLSDSECIDIYTSGSTGAPKLIQLPKERMINSALMTQKYFNLGIHTTALLSLPISYIAGKMMVVRAFVIGMNLITVAPSANPFLQLTDKIYFGAITPFQLANSMPSLKDKDFGTLIVGGGEIPYELERRCDTIQTALYATYGMSETSSHIAIRRVNGMTKSPNYEVLQDISISVDQRGCLIIEAPSLVDEAIITNDVVALIDPNHFEWQGRIDHVINTGGIKLFPEQIEKKISALIPTRFFIAGLPDNLLGEKVVLFIEGEPYNSTDLNTLQQNLKVVLSKFEIPREIIFIPHFDLSESGKILKNQIVSSYLTAD